MVAYVHKCVLLSNPHNGHVTALPGGNKQYPSLVSLV